MLVSFFLEQFFFKLFNLVFQTFYIFESPLFSALLKLVLIPSNVVFLIWFFFLQNSILSTFSCIRRVSNSISLLTSEGRLFISSIVGSRDRAMVYCSFASSSSLCCSSEGFSFLECSAQSILLGSLF